MSGPLRDIAAAAEWLDVKPTWLRDAVTAGKVPHTRIGKHVRFTEEHLAAIVAAGERAPVTARTVRARVVPINRPARVQRAAA